MQDSNDEARRPLLVPPSPPEVAICDDDIDEHEQEMAEGAEQWEDESRAQSANAAGNTEGRGRLSGGSTGGGGNKGKRASSSISGCSGSNSGGPSKGASDREVDTGSASGKEGGTGKGKAKRPKAAKQRKWELHGRQGPKGGGSEGGVAT